MAKPKRKHLAAVVMKSTNNQLPLESSIDVSLDSELSEDSWVIVKKQKVTVLIPCLPSTELCLIPDVDLGQGQLQLDVPSNLTSTPPQLPQASEVCLVEKSNASMSLSPKSSSQSAPPDNLVAMSKPGKLNPRRRNIEDQLGALQTLFRKKRSSLKFHEIAHKPSKALEQSRQSKICDLPGSTTFLNKMLRASNLERKIVRAGGLGRWLSSLGLEQFERIFRGKNVSKFQLATLSMQKLKDMGAHAVGPRRKLIHAIECLCESYYS